MSIPADRSPPWEEGRISTRIRSSSTPSSGTAVERLTDDLFVEILSRVPAKSLCRFKCVSNHWLSLIDHPHHRKKLPQTLTGFFYTNSTFSDDWLKGVESPLHFTSVSGRRRDTSFPFLSNRSQFDLLDCCNGLLLCRWCDVFILGGELIYVVFNPATKKWFVIPDYIHLLVSSSPRLCFDPSLSSHFHVFDLVDDEFEWELNEHAGPGLGGVSVYSSETGGWVYKEKTWDEHIRLIDFPKTVFLNGYVHFLADSSEVSDCLAVVDTKGETWMNFPVPGGLNEGFVQQSQGRLNYANFRRAEDGAALQLAVYVLENYQSKKWILTHSVETSYLFGAVDVQLDLDFYWIAIHPDCNSVFFTVGCDKTLMCYNMDHRQVKVICNVQKSTTPYLPYVPLYAELQSLHV